MGGVQGVLMLGVMALLGSASVVAGVEAIKSLVHKRGFRGRIVDIGVFQISVPPREEWTELLDWAKQRIGQTELSRLRNELADQVRRPFGSDHEGEELRDVYLYVVGVEAQSRTLTLPLFSWEELPTVHWYHVRKYKSGQRIDVLLDRNDEGRIEPGSVTWECCKAVLGIPIGLAMLYVCIRTLVFAVFHV